MNKRKFKKKVKKLQTYLENNFDFLDDNGNYRTIPIKCHYCEYFESGDSSVGLLDSCITPSIYDENDDIIEKMNEKIIFHMEYLGYLCPYFKKKKITRYL